MSTLDFVADIDRAVDTAAARLLVRKARTVHASFDSSFDSNHALNCCCSSTAATVDNSSGSGGYYNSVASNRKRYTADDCSDRAATIVQPLAVVEGSDRAAQGATESERDSTTLEPNVRPPCARVAIARSIPP